MKMRLAMSGVLALAVGGCAMQQAQRAEKEDHEENEVKVTMAEVPQAVQATLQREAEGTAITSVDKESDEGKVVYEADAMIAGQNYEIKVAEDGKLIKKAIDNEDEEKGEKGEKAEKGGSEEKEEKGEH